MPFAQECAERLREQAYRTLLPQIKDLEQELQSFSSFLSTGVRQLEQKLEMLSHTELPATEAVLSEILDEVIRHKDTQTSILALFAQGVRTKETQEEILGFLLDSTRAYFPRVALFAVRGDRFIGWSSRGYSDAQAKEISSCSFLRSDLVPFEEAVESEKDSVSANLPGFLKENSSGPWHIFPLRAMQRPVAVLLGEADGDSKSCLDAIPVLISLTALRLENIALKILYELTSEKTEATPKSVPAKTIPAAAAFEQTPAPVFEAVSAPSLEPETRPETGPGISEAEIEPTAAEMPPPLETAPAFDELAAAVTETPQIPASPVPPADAIQAQPIADEEKLHMEARRFARLLVSEIKLYNEHHVLEGRENRDLYLRLKRDIDRSREMYEKRVSAQVSRRIDYFHDEIIRILGDNDPSTLGSDYPGPRVES
jgi:hypothetical protein